MKKLVSVIVPVFNRAELVLRTLSTIDAQSYQNIELIIVDDGSTDNSLKVLQEYKKNYTGDKDVKIFSTSNNNGAPAARNFGFKRSMGEYIVFFDSDDIMLPTRIQMQVQKMEQEDTQSCACGFYFDNPQGYAVIPPLIGGDNVLRQNIIRNLWGSTQMWIFSRVLIDRVGGYDLKLKCKQDLDLVFRILMTEPSVSIIQEALSVFINHDGSERIMKNSNSVVYLPSIIRYNYKVLRHCLYKQNKKTFLIAMKLFVGDIRALKDNRSELYEKSTALLKLELKDKDLSNFHKNLILALYVQLFRLYDVRQFSKKMFFSI